MTQQAEAQKGYLKNYLNLLLRVLGLVVLPRKNIVFGSLDTLLMVIKSFIWPVPRNNVWAR